MRILHLADLHLGKLVHEVSMIEDQAHVLDHIVLLAREGRADVVVITGDVYDRAIPPVAATRLMDDFLSRLALDLRLPVIITPGNHDSAERLAFGGRLLQAGGIHIAPGLPEPVRPVVLHDTHGPVHFLPLPYVSPVLLKEREDDLPTGDFDEALGRVLAALPPAPGRCVCLAHCFALGGAPSDSERPLSIGGACQVDPARFAPYQLTLLGHLHRPQQAAPTVFYAGSPLKYSFSETDHAKSAALYDLAADGSFTRELAPLPPRREMRRLEGPLHALLEAAPADPGRNDYLWIHLTDRGALFDYAPRLREAYPNALSITRAAYGEDAGEQGGIDLTDKTEWEIVRGFFLHVSGQEPEPGEERVLRAVVDEMLRQDMAEADAVGEPGAAQGPGEAGADPTADGREEVRP